MKKTSTNKRIKHDQIQQVFIRTEIGEIYIIGSNDLIFMINNKKNPRYPMQLNSKTQLTILRKAQKQIREYLSGKRRKIELPFKLEGTAFQQTVWKEVHKIPFGQKLTYKELAQKIENPKALRAVGSAVGKNPLCLLIPCHRIIGSKGKLGGFSMGLEIKKYLLNLEGSTKEIINL